MAVISEASEALGENRNGVNNNTDESPSTGVTNGELDDVAGVAAAGVVVAAEGDCGRGEKMSSRKLKGEKEEEEAAGAGAGWVGAKLAGSSEEMVQR